MEPSGSFAVFRFGPFESRLRSKELFKHGSKLKVRPQPLQVLNLLLSRRGDVVTRDELRQQLWSSETFVDFENGLNTSIKELRAVLGDSASEPKYIETLPKVGYRFIWPVEKIRQLTDAESSQMTPKEGALRQSDALDEGERGLPGGAGATTSADHWNAGRERANSVSAESAPITPAEPRTAAQPMQPPAQFTNTPTTSAAPAAVAANAFPLWRAFSICALALAVALAGYWLWSSRAKSHAVAGRVTLAVLPFENLTGDASQEYFSDGLTEEMIAQLGRRNPEHIAVIGRTSVMRYKNGQATLPDIGRELGVQYVVEGSVRRDADNVRITAKLVRVGDQSSLWSHQYDRERNNLLTLQGEIAEQVGSEVESVLGVQPKPGSSAANLSKAQSTSSSEAYDSYLLGRFFWNKRTPAGFSAAADYFQKAIDKDPKYALAYAGLADTYAMMSSYTYVSPAEYTPKARAAAMKAVELDDSLAEAHTSLGLIAQNYDHDWQTAEKEYRRAIELDPDYATAHHWLGECLAFQGRFDEAYAEYERARQLDPLSMVILNDYAVALAYGRQFDRAIVEFRHVQEMAPDFPRAHMVSMSYAETGQYERALSEIDAWEREGANSWLEATRVWVLARAGRESEARALLKTLEQKARQHEASPAQMLLATARLDKEQAFSWMQKSFEEHAPSLSALKVDPAYDSLRSDPRFNEYMRLLHLAK